MGLALLRDEQVEQITMLGETMGSIDYMAPEQWEDCHSVDWRSDVYSLGCTFYCLLSGRAPFSDHQRGSVSRMRAHLQSEFPDIRDQRADVPDEAVKLLAAMVAKDPEDRLTDLAQISSRLEIIASGDLKGLVERGFAQTGDQRSPAPLPKPNRPGTGSQQNVASDTVDQTDRRVAVAPAALRGDTKRIRGTVIACLAAGCVIGLLALGIYAMPSTERSDAANGLLPEVTILDTSADEESAVANSTFIELHEPLVCVGHQAKVMDVIFLDPQPKIASVSDDGVLCIFEMSNPAEPLHTIQVSDRGAVSLAYDPDAETLAIVCADGSLQLRSASDGEIIQSEKLANAGYTSLARLSGKAAYATSDWGGDVRLVDLSADPVRNDLIVSRAEVVYDVDASADGTLMAWVGRDPVVTLFNRSTQTATDLPGHKHWVYEVAFAPNSKRMATAGHEGLVRVWSLPQGELESEIEHIVPQALCFFPDSQRLAIGGRGGMVKVWDLDTNLSLQSLSVGKSIDCVAVSGDAKWLAAGATDGTLKVWPVSID
jgi:WD40 repeat protein